MRTAYSYIRFSSARQAKGDSLRRQLEATEAWCKRNDCRLSDLTFRDLGVSAWKGRNCKEGGLFNFREAIVSGAVKPGSVLVVEHLDRISRDEIDVALSVFSEILRAGVDIVTVQNERIYTRESLRNIAQVLEAVLSFVLANEESEKKSKRLKEVWMNKRKAGGKIGPNPAWLVWNKDRYAPIPERVNVVRQIYDWASEGIGNFAIIRKLTAQGTANFGKGKGWNHSYISIILNSRAVIGERVFADGSTIKDYYPAVVERDVFFKVQEQVRQRDGKAKFRGRGARTCLNLFSGLLQDARDGGSLVVSHRAIGGDYKRRRAIIGSYNATRGKNVPFISFPLQELELAILLELQELRRADFFQTPRKPRKAELTALETELGETIDNIASIQQEVMQGKSKAKSILDLLNALEAKQKRLHAELETLQASSENHDENALTEITDLISEMAQSDDTQGIRERLQGRIRSLLTAVVIMLTKEKTVPGWQGYSFDTLAVVELRFRNGQTRTFRIRYSRGELHFEK